MLSLHFLFFPLSKFVGSSKHHFWYYLGWGSKPIGPTINGGVKKKHGRPSNWSTTTTRCTILQIATTIVEFNWPRFLNMSACKTTPWLIDEVQAFLFASGNLKKNRHTPLLFYAALKEMSQQFHPTIAYILLPTDGGHQLQWKSKVLKSTACHVKLSQAASWSGNRTDDCLFTCTELHTRLLGEKRSIVAYEVMQHLPN